jgi:hypothetical protein
MDKFNFAMDKFNFMAIKWEEERIYSMVNWIDIMIIELVVAAL